MALSMCHNFLSFLFKLIVCVDIFEKLNNNLITVIECFKHFLMYKPKSIRIVFSIGFADQHTSHISNIVLFWTFCTIGAADVKKARTYTDPIN